MFYCGYALKPYRKFCILQNFVIQRLLQSIGNINYYMKIGANSTISFIKKKFPQSDADRHRLNFIKIHRENVLYFISVVSFINGKFNYLSNSIVQ